MNVTEHLILDPVLAPPWSALVVAALAAAMVAVALRRPPAVSRWRRAAILVLRLAAVAIVAMLLFRPAVRWEGREEVPGEVVVLLDDSRSMAIRDEAALLPVRASPDASASGTRTTAITRAEPVRASPDASASGTRPTAITRAEAVRQAFLAARKPYTDLAERFVTDPFAFGTHTRLAGNFAPEPIDLRTDISETLDFAADWARPDERGRGRPAAGGGRIAGRVSAVILISDGRANRSRGSAEDAARQLAERGAKVHTVLVGADKPGDRVRDAAIRDLRAPARVFAGNRPEVRATVATLGLAGRSLTCVLTVNGKEVERQNLTPPSNQAVQEVVFAPEVGPAGLARVAVSVDPVQGELVATNNRAERIVRVEEGGVRVLYLDGRIHPEGKYIARVLDEAAGIELDRRLLVGGASAPEPADIDAHDVLLLGDLPAAALPAATVARIAGRVREGKLSLLALGGVHAFGAGGWAASPLADLLPVAIRDGDGKVPGPIRFKPTPAAARHFVLNVEVVRSPADKAPDPLHPDPFGAGAFDALPALGGASVVGPLGPGAQLLAESQDGRPLLAVRTVATGRSPQQGGRVAALTVDTTWQWALAPGETRGAEVHRQFWERLVLWLAGRDERPQADISVAADRPRYLLADPDNPPTVEIAARVTQQAAQSPALVLTGPDGAKQKVELAASEGVRSPKNKAPDPSVEWRATVPLRTPGVYTVAAEATVGGTLRHAETKFVVDGQDFETANLLADAEAMQRIARAGGGTFRRIEDLGNLLAELAADLPPQSEAVERRLSLASGRVFLAVALVLLAAQWVLLRRWRVG